MSRKATVTDAQRIARQQRLATILSLRLQGWSLREIGESLSPACSPQAVHKCIKRALERMVDEAVGQARQLELLRLDELTVGVYGRALDGDLGCVDAVLSLMQRRARLLGLDVVQRFGSADESDPPKVKIEVVGDPALARAEQTARVCLSQGPHLA